MRLEISKIQRQLLGSDPLYRDLYQIEFLNALTYEHASLTGKVV
jgi:hypothetical protein